MCSFDCDIYIRTSSVLKVKVLHFSTVNIRKVVTDTASNTITIKCDDLYGLTISILIVDLWPFLKVNLPLGTESSQIFVSSCFPSFQTLELVTLRNIYIYCEVEECYLNYKMMR